MATPTLGLLGHTEIDDADDNTNWTGDLDTADADIVKEGAASLSGIFRADLDNGYYDDGTPRSIAGEHLRMWVLTNNLPYMETTANGGYEVFVHDGTNTDYYTIFSSDDYTGGWFNAVIDCALFTTVTDANVDRWGLRANHTTNAKNAINTWVDYIRYMDGYYITGGTSGDKVTLADVAGEDREVSGTLTGYGIIEEIEGVYFCSGEFQLGNGATTTYFEMDGDVLVYTDKPVADGLYALNGNGAGANILIVDSTIKASGTGDANRPDIDMSTGSPGTVSITDTVVIRGGALTFASGQTITGNTFNDCEQITHGGATMTGITVKGYEGTADTGALVYNVASDIDGEIDGSTFEMGTASTHAIDFGTSVTMNQTIRNCEFTGYGTSDDSNDSTVRFLATSGSLTLSLVNCTVGGSAATTSNFSVDDAAGITVTLEISVTITITVKDIEGNLISNAQTAVYATDDDTELMNEDTVSGVATESYGGTLPREVRVWIRKASSGATKYKNYSSIQTITSAGLTLTVTMVEDPYNNATT